LKDTSSSLDSSAIPVSGKHLLLLSQFRNFWLGRTISVLGDQFYIVALPWIVFQLTDSGKALGTVLTLTALPRATLMLIGGTLTDRFSSRRILIWMSILRTMLVAAIAALLWFQRLQLWELYVITIIYGATDAFASPAGAALLPSFLEKSQLQAANSLIQSSSSVVQLVGPAIAGWLIRIWSIAVALVFDALSFIPLTASLFQLPEPKAPAPQKTTGKWKTLRSIQEGLSTVRNDPSLMWLMLLFAVLNLCVTGPISVGLPLLVKLHFGSAAAFGTILTFFSGGALAGAALAGVLQKLRKRGLLFVSISGLTGLEIVGMGMTANFVVLTGLLVLMGLGLGFLNVVFATWFQTRVEQRLLGRVMSVLLFCTQGLVPISLAASGFIANWSLRNLFVICGTIIFGAALVTGSRRSANI
jgi:MFS family permease